MYFAAPGKAHQGELEGGPAEPERRVHHPHGAQRLPQLQLPFRHDTLNLRGATNDSRQAQTPRVFESGAPDEQRLVLEFCRHGRTAAVRGGRCVPSILLRDAVRKTALQGHLFACNMGIATPGRHNSKRLEGGGAPPERRRTCWRQTRRDPPASPPVSSRQPVTRINSAPLPLHGLLLNVLLRAFAGLLLCWPSRQTLRDVGTALGLWLGHETSGHG